MGKNKNKRAQQAQQSQSGQPNVPPQQAWSGNQANPFVPDRLSRIQQVDSWRSYRNDTSNVQTTADSQFFYSPQPGFVGNSQKQGQPSFLQASNDRAWGGPRQQTMQPLGQYTRSPAPQAMDPAALPFHPPSTEHSHLKPYQPLRVSNGSSEILGLQQEVETSYTQPQSNMQAKTQDPWARYKLRQRPPPVAQPTAPPTRRDRYPLRQRTHEQIAPYSTGAADRILPSIERPDTLSASRELTSSSATSRHRQAARVPGPPAPKPTELYMTNAKLEPFLRDKPAKLLVILDLNGTLLVRPNRNKPKHIIVRPGVPAFLQYLFRNHVVMVYSSAKPQNCTAMIQQFFRPEQREVVAAVWARDKLGLTIAQYESKTQVYKKLEPIWQDEEIQGKAEPGTTWNQSNTVLVDDSKLKALAQPHNLLQIPEFLNNEPKHGIREKLDWRVGEEAIVQSVQQKLEELKWQVDVSRLIREWQLGKRQAPGVVDETVDQKALTNPEGHLPSPTPTPSTGDRGSSEAPEHLHKPRDSSMVPSEPDTGVSSGDEGGVTLDHLAKEINRTLSVNAPDHDQERNQSHQQRTGAASAAGTAATTGTDHRKRPRATEPALDPIREFKARRKLEKKARHKAHRKERRKQAHVRTKARRAIERAGKG